MKNFFLVLLLAAVLLAASACYAQQPLPLPIPVVKDTVQRLRLVLDEQNTTIQGISTLRSQHSDRKVAALVILLQALRAAGLHTEPEFIEVPNAAREREMVRRGQAVVSGQDLFAAAFPDDVFMSLPVIPEGRFAKGVYGLPENTALQSIRTLDDLRGFSAVSSSGWRVDWATLTQIAPKRLESVTTHHTMFSLIAHRDIDFTLYEFPPRGDLSQHLDGITLVPVPGVKVILKGSRHFMVSKRHPDGREVFDALQRGLMILHARGVIERLLTDVGFYNPAVEDWTVLNP